MYRDNQPIPVVDLFAGPGGLGEGFATCTDAAGRRVYEVRLSVEKDPPAHRTLTLRAFVHAFNGERLPEAYYDLLRGRLTMEQLFERHPIQAETARRRAWLCELGPATARHVRRRIGEALAGCGDRPWVLIGGPPCQAYSLAGRSRNRGIAGYVPEEDERQRLYVEYLWLHRQNNPTCQPSAF